MRKEQLLYGDLILRESHTYTPGEEQCLRESEQQAGDKDLGYKYGEPWDGGNDQWRDQDKEWDC